MNKVLTIGDLRKKLLQKEVSPTEITKNYLDKINLLNPKFNSFITICAEHAMIQAKESEKRIMAGNARPMEGIPMAVKDLFCTQNIKTTAGSNILHNFIPNYESFVTQKLWDNGAILLGKLNMDEFAMGSTNLNSYFGPVINPIKRTGDNSKLIPGGSSGGSASAVSSDLCVAALGSDTGGSVRQPASFTATVGVKPSYGRCSRWGMIAYASSLDQAGVIAKNSNDAAEILQIISGFDTRDSTSISKKIPNYNQDMELDVKGLKIGIPKEYSPPGMDDTINKIWQNAAHLLEKAGAELVEISLPHTEYAAPTYYIISTAEASSNLARYDGIKYGLRSEGKSLEEIYENTRAKGFGKEVKLRIMLGTYVLSAGYFDAYYKKALKIRRLISDDFDHAFKNIDVILTPTTPNVAYNLEEKMSEIETYNNDIFTVSVNLAGLPAISIPAGVNKDNLPLGIQIIAPRFQEKLMFRVASNLEQKIAFDHNILNYR